MKKAILLGAIAALALGGASLAGAMITVDQKDIAFSVPRLVTPKGSILNFTNSDRTSHNILITGAGLTFNSGLQQAGVAFKVPLSKAGEYQVTCGIHPKMKMTVVVQ